MGSFPGYLICLVLPHLSSAPCLWRARVASNPGYPLKLG